jgi:hypothetical protein
MTSVLTDQIKSCIRGAETAREMLVFAIGPSGAGKTRFLKSVADNMGMTYLPLGGAIARRLVDVPARRRPMALEAITSEIMDSSSKQICVDNSEILFQKTLHCDPVRFAMNLSHSRLLLFALNGAFSDGQLIHGYPDHPEYFTADLRGFPVITFSEQSPEPHNI